MSSQNIKILLSIVIVLGVTLFYLSNKQSSVPAVEDNPVVATKVDTTTWVTYEDKEKGLKFKYPSDFHVTEGSEYEEPYAFSVDIVFPDKFQDQKSLELRKIEELMAYGIAIIPLENRKNFGKSNAEILKQLKAPDDLEEISTADGHVIFFDVNNGDSAYYIGDNVYQLVPAGYNNSNKNINNSTDDLEFKNDYPNYIKLMSGIFSTFEFTK